MTATVTHCTDAASATVAQCVVRLNAADIGHREFSGRTWFGWILRELIRYGVDDFLVLADALPPDLQASLPCQVRITLATPPAGSGSGGALLAVREQLQDRFLLFDGSTPLDWNFAALLSGGATDDAGLLARIVRREGQTNSATGLFHIGLIDFLQPVCCLQADVLPDLVRRGLVKITPMAGESVDASGPHDEPCNIVTRLRRKSLFLDRDGVLNLDHGYVGSRDRFEWMPGALAMIRYASDAGWHVFLVTNQSGVARGLYTEDAVRHLLRWMAGQARAAGGTIDDARFCPFHPAAELVAYRQAHPWRKPMPGMLLDLISAWELDPGQAVMVGDQATDMEAAAAAGVAGYMFRGGDLLHFVRPILDRGFEVAASGRRD